MKIKTHPVMIIRYIYPFLFALFVPIIRAFFEYITTKSYKNILLSEAVIAAVVLAFGILKYRRLSVRFKDGCFIINSGLFVRVSTVVLCKKIFCIILSQNILDVCFGSATLVISTDAGRGKNSIKLKVQKSQIKELEKMFVTTDYTTYKISGRRAAGTALAMAKVSAGVLPVFAFLINAAKALNVNLQNIIKTELQYAFASAASVARHLLYFFAALSLLGYVISFAVYLVRCMGLTLSQDKNFIKITTRFFVLKTILINTQNITVLQYITPPLMAGHKLSVLCAAGGDYYSRGANGAVLKICTCEDTACVPKLYPANKTLFRFVRFALLGAVLMLITAATLFAQGVKNTDVLALPLIVCAVFLNRMLINIRIRKNSYVALQDKMAILNLKGHTKILSVITLNKIAEIRIKSNFFSLKKNLCTFQVRTTSKKCKFYRLKYAKLGENFNVFKIFC